MFSILLISPTFQPILYHWSLSIPPGNVTPGVQERCEMYRCFQGYWHEMD